MNYLPSRQVHLDFHTSEHIPDVGSNFDKDNFQKALKLGNLNSITVFAKCHHSWSYYPTKVGMVHPNLKPNFDLTGAMVEAAHELGVRAPIYITVGWSANDAENHPEWVAKKKDGTIAMSRGKDGAVDMTNEMLNASPDQKRPIVSWKYLCPNGGYGELIYKQTREICDRYPVVDGLFYDINFRPLCWCDNCVREMEQKGFNSENGKDVRKYHRIKWRRFMRKCVSILHEKHAEATIFFNGGGADPYQPEWHNGQTHFEMEDLPTTWGGYNKMPLRAKYFARSGKDYMGMTGKFHTMWGEFGGFKTGKALRYECAAMLTYGARCIIGDQMHPSGKMDLEAYRLIGDAYQYVEEIEPWCYEVEETTRLGIILSSDKKSDQGLVRMLLEKQLDFNIAFKEDDLSRYNTLILPDSVQLDQTFANKINKFIEEGGGVLLTGASGLNMKKSKFMIDVGAQYQGTAFYDNDYLKLGAKLNQGIVSSPILFYEGAYRVKVKDANVLAKIKEPYFDRTYAHYCSHQNTPYKLENAEYPGAICKNNVVYLAHPVCKLYQEHGAQFHRDYLINALNLIYRDPVLKVDMPSAGRARFVNQIAKNRYILHLLYGSPIKRGRALVIEDLPPLFDIKVELKVGNHIKKAYLAPEGKEIKFEQKNDRVSFSIPEVKCHQIVVFDY